MANAQLDQFIHVLIWKAGPLIIFCICGAIVLPELVRRIARRVTRSIHARADRRTLNTPHCPSCDRPMVKRTVRRGFRAGSEFWGCSNYPACSDTRSA
jgi:Topoisomerase DNA binding C4 zinc finger